MKKHLPFILTALLVLAFATGYFLLRGTASKKQAGRLFNLGSQEAIETIDIVNTYGAFSFRYEAEAGAWQVVNEGMVYRANQTKMDLMLDSLKSFKIMRSLSQERKEYGFDQAQALVRFTSSKGKTRTFMVGDPGPDELSVYIKDLDEDKILMTDLASVAQLTGSLNAYRSKDVFNIDLVTTRRIEYFQYDQLVLTCYSPDGSNWFMDYPYQAPARVIEISELIASMKNWTIAGYPDYGVDAQAMGLDNPAERIHLVDAAGASQSIEFGAEEGIARFARIGGVDDLVVLYAVDVDLSSLRPDLLLFVAPLRATMDEILSITIEKDDQAYVLTYDPETNLSTLNEKPISYDDFVGIFFKYIALVASGVDEHEEPGKQLASFRTHFRDGSAMSLDLFERDKETCFMAFEGGKGYVMKMSKLESLFERIGKLVGKG